MTETEWLACIDIEPMLEGLVTIRYPDAEPCNWGRGERKKRLFVCACLSRILHLLPNEYRRAFEMFDPDVDAQVSEETHRALWSSAERVSCVHANLLFAVGYDDIGLLCYYAARIAVGAATDSRGEARQIEDRQQQGQRAHAMLLREVFGNPFQSSKLDPTCLTHIVVQLAQTIYNDRAFDRMPELADALHDAGCDNDEILRHCRGPGPHVRGCWVVDLVLGKE